jgi:hypothetical protein
MCKVNSLIGTMMVGLMAAGSQANASNWVMNGSSCVPNNTSINDYFVTGGSVTQKQNSVEPIILYCPITGTWGSFKPTILNMTYMNSDPLIAMITAQVIRLDGHTGLLSMISPVLRGATVTNTGLRVGTSFSHPFDFANSYYYIRVDITRRDTTAFAKLFGVSLDCATCPTE